MMSDCYKIKGTEIILKADWDRSINSPSHDEHDEPEGHFAGRRAEIDQLKNEILTKPNSSILIAGYAGIGKTSLVYKALREIKETCPHSIMVLLNAPQLEAYGSDPGIEPRIIIQNLIRRLYSATPHLRNKKEIKRKHEKRKTRSEQKQISASIIKKLKRKCGEKNPDQKSEQILVRCI